MRLYYWKLSISCVYSNGRAEEATYNTTKEKYERRSVFSTNVWCILYFKCYIENIICFVKTCLRFEC